MIRSRRDVLALLGGVLPASAVLSKILPIRPPTPAEALDALVRDVTSAYPADGFADAVYRGSFKIPEGVHLCLEGTPARTCTRCGLTKAEIVARGLRGKCKGSHAA